MRQFTLILSLLMLLSLNGFGQVPDDEFQREVKHRRDGMMVLGSWAVLNLTSGLYLRANRQGVDRSFHEMNALWNTVNLGIAGAGFLAAMRLEQPESAAGLMQLQHDLDKVLLFNAGLDLAYIAAGFWMIERSKTVGKQNDRWRGYGQSVILQGAALFAFDVLMVVLHPEANSVSQLHLGFVPGAADFLRMSYTF